ncbi:MAG: response regulator [Alphaproteobacteria bacterium]|nr:response regulator [Alphaproteobacteria bacterium]
MAADKSMKVLVVDDYQTMCTEICNTFKFMGFENTDCTSTTTQALEKLKNDNYGLVIYDWFTGPNNGAEFFKAMSEDKLRQIPIIVVSNVINDDMRKEMADIGVPEYLTKPFNTSVLSKKLIAIFGE